MNVFITTLQGYKDKGKNGHKNGTYCDLIQEGLKNWVWDGPIVMMKIDVHNRGFPGKRISLRLRVRITEWVGQSGFSRYKYEDEAMDYTMQVVWSRWTFQA